MKITPDAAEKLKKIILESNEGTDIPSTAGVRFLRDESGYRLDLEAKPREDDHVIELNGIRVFIEPDILPLVKDYLIYWRSDPKNSGFALEDMNSQRVSDSE